MSFTGQAERSEPIRPFVTLETFILEGPEREVDAFWAEKGMGLERVSGGVIPNAGVFPVWMASIHISVQRSLSFSKRTEVAMSDDKIRDMLMEGIMRLDYDMWKDFKPDLSEDPEYAAEEMDACVAIVREHLERTDDS